MCVCEYGCVPCEYLFIFRQIVCVDLSTPLLPKVPSALGQFNLILPAVPVSAASGPFYKCCN